MLERMLLTAVFTALGLGLCAGGRWWYLRRASRQTGPIRAGRPAVLYFCSDHCAPCAAQWRFLEQVQAQFGDGLAIEKIDADLEPEKTERFGVFTLPTTLLMDARGVVRHANYGLADARKLGAQVQGLLNG